ncbi:MAG: membrane dipeptidase [Bacilli bacterium]|nr:membrane dipeptidase [Bacilli bacterium]
MIFDAHGDILTDLYEQGLKNNPDSFRTRHLDLYQKGKVTHSIFVNWTDPKTTDPLLFDKIFDYAFQELPHYKDIIEICYNYEDMLRAEKQNKIGVIIGMEGVMQLRDVNHLIALYQKGVRHASLTWNEENKYASGLDNPNTRGLSDEGKEIILKMQELGMVIDLAHANSVTFDDVISLATGPIVITHGNTKALCDHRRNYTDEQLLKIKNTNGVIGICGIKDFISSDKDNQNVQYMVKHIDHAVKVMGIDHVGLGFDFCYYLYAGVSDNKVEGLKTIADVQNIFTELQKLGYSEHDIEKIKHKNFERVIQTVLK